MAGADPLWPRAKRRARHLRQSPWVFLRKSWRGRAERGREKAKIAAGRRGTPETLAGVRVPQEVTDGAGASRVTCAAYQGHVQKSKNQLGALGMQVDSINRVSGSGSAPSLASLLLVISTYQGAVDQERFRPCASRDA